MSSSWTNCQRGSKPRIIGTAGRPSSRLYEVRSSGPRPCAKRRTVTVDVRVLGREVGDGALGLDDVALDRGPGRVRAAHVLGEEGGVVLLGAVEVRPSEGRRPS